MKAEIKEVRIEVKIPNACLLYIATIRDGKLTAFDKIAMTIPGRDEIRAFITFCQEVLAEIE